MVRPETATIAMTVEAAYAPVIPRLPTVVSPRVVPSEPMGRHVGVGDYGIVLGGVDLPVHHEFYLDFEDRISANGRIALAPGFRGNGLGSALVRARERICKELGIRCIVVGMSENDGFWDGMGYTRSDPVEREHFSASGVWTLPGYATYHKWI